MIPNKTINPAVKSTQSSIHLKREYHLQGRQKAHWMMVQKAVLQVAGAHFRTAVSWGS